MKLCNCIEIRLRYQSFNSKAVEILKKKMQSLSSDIFLFSSIRLPIKKKRITLLRSPHVNKKSRDQLEIRLYNGLFIFRGNSLNSSFLETLKSLSIPEMSLKFSISGIKKASKSSIV